MLFTTVSSCFFSLLCGQNGRYMAQVENHRMEQRWPEFVNRCQRFVDRCQTERSIWQAQEVIRPSTQS